MTGLVRGTLGLGLTLFVLAAGMAVVNGLVRGWSLWQLQRNPYDATALALLQLY
jgi:ABC-type arginine/histidine transport system permease subunit